MNLVKKYGPILGIMGGIILFFLFFIVVLNYVGLINQSTLAVLKISLTVLCFFTGGLIVGKRSNKKGWLEGLKISGIIILLFIIVNLLFIHSFHLKYFLYYIILIYSSILGSIIGINKKQE